MAETKTVTIATEGRGPRRPSALAYHAYCEVLKLLRVPVFILPTFLFPLLFFAMFGLPNVNDTVDGANAGRYIIVSYGTYAVMATSLFSFSVTIATERGLGWNKLLKTTPLRTFTFFATKCIMAAVFGLAVLLVLFAFGALVGGIEMGFGLWARLVGLLAIGMLPFVALGLMLGYLTGPNSSAAIANLVFLPLAFGSGLFLPLEFLPQLVREIAPFLPPYHVAQLGWQAIGAGDGAPVAIHLLWVAAYTLVFLVLAAVVYRRDEGRVFG